MKAIASSVRLTAASLYHHFPGKDVLLLAVLELGITEILRRITPIADSDLPAADRLRGMIAAHVTGLADNTAIGAAMVFEIRTVSTVKAPSRTASPADHAAYADYLQRRAAFFAQRDQFERLFRRVIADGIATGEFRPVDAAIFARTMLGAQNWVGVWYRPEGRLTGAEIAVQIADTFLAALLPVPAALIDRL